MVYHLKIIPAINPDTRHRIQEFLESLGYGEIVGGHMLDGSFCDISFKLKDGMQVENGD